MSPSGQRNYETLKGFAVRMHQRYLQVKNKSSVGVRRLHYFIIGLPESERMVFIRNGQGKRPYDNTLIEYHTLSQALVKARYEGLIPWDSVIDEKNPDVVFMPDRVEAKTTVSVTLPDLGTCDLKEMPSWDEFSIGISTDASFSPSEFVCQTHRIVVVCEKATSTEEIQELCQEYGADYICLSGRHSVTRIYDVVKRAQEEGKPIRALYMSDLDPAGWDMPRSFMARLQEMYPYDELGNHMDHKPTRVLLTRPQARQYNLPPSFDVKEKNYDNKTLARFIEETGSDVCIELDALDENVFLSLLERELQKVAALDEDVKSKDALKKVYSAPEPDLSDFQKEYEEIQVGYNEIFGEIESKILVIQKLLERMDEIKSEIEIAYDDEIEDLGYEKGW
jgi:hypothetical protein